MQNTPFKIVLVHPQIHWNTGAIGRSCVALNAELVIIHPCGFSFDEREVKRAGLDYWEHVKISHYDNWESFLEAEQPDESQMFFLSTKSEKIYYDADFREGCYLVFGSETAGLPEFFHKTYKEQFYKMPMFSDEIRSLNLANSATAVAYEAIRKII